jgi:hypothetical protein
MDVDHRAPGFLRWKKPNDRRCFLVDVVRILTTRKKARKKILLTQKNLHFLIHLLAGVRDYTTAPFLYSQESIALGH